MITGGWIKISRSLLSWRWYGDANTTRVWIHLLLRANYEDRPLRDFVVRRGETAISLATLAEETGLSVKSVRTALSHLEETGEVARKRQGHITVISIPNYDLYQSESATQGQLKGNSSATQGQRWKNKRNKEGEEGKTRAKRAASPSGSLYMRAVEWQREAEEEMAAEEAAEAAEDEE